MTEQDAARKAGRGFVSITGAKVYFIVTSYAIQLLLPRFLGSAEAFGLFSTALNVASMVNNMLIVATVQTVSKFVSEGGDRAGEALRRGLAIQLVIGTALGTAFLLGAGPMGDALRDPAVVPLLRFAAAVVFSYSLYAAFVGALNGQHFFQRQAVLDMTFSTLRTAGILGAAALGFGAVGAMAGFGTAAVVIGCVAAAWVGLGQATASPIPVRTWLAFTAPLWLYHGFLNLLMQVDLAMLKRLVADLATASGTSAADAAERASELVAYYRAAQTFAFVPYQLILSLTFIIFPMVSKAIATGDHAATAQYVRAGMRVAILFLLAIATPIAGGARAVIGLAFPADYVAGAGALQILVFGMVAFALFVIAATILTSLGRPGIAAAIAALGCAIVVAAVTALVRGTGLDGDVLGAAALGTTIGTTVAFACAGAAVYVRTRALIAPLTALRGLVAGAAGFFVADALAAMPGARIMGLVALAGGFAAFAITAVLLGEIGRAELAVVKRIVKR